LDSLYNLFIKNISPIYPYIKNVYDNDYGTIAKLDPMIFKISPGILDDNVNYYKCK